jgi:thiol:disulfide interchange protein
MRGALWVICLAGPLLVDAQAEIMAAEELPAYSLHYDPACDPFSDGRDALRLARETGRRVLVEVGGDWCSWCHVLDRFLKQHAAARMKLHENFVVLKVNVDDSNDNAEFLAGFPPTQGYPHMYVTGSDGTILHSQDTAEFLHNGRYAAQRFLDFVHHWGGQNE